MLVNTPSLKNERGTSMIELVVGLGMGMVVMVGLTLTMIAVIHGTARVDARVEATDNARVVVSRITEELHSACVSPQIAPVRAGSTGTTLIFWHAPASQSSVVAPTPIKSKIVYSSGTLTQTDYAQVGGTSPNWTFEGEGTNKGTGTSTKLLTNVAPGNGTAVFSYAKYEGGEAKTLSVTELTEEKAAETVTVNIALTASPKTSPVKDSGSTATVKDSATMRLTPPSFESSASALPCQ